jgi:tight adherence protein C
MSPTTTALVAAAGVVLGSYAVVRSVRTPSPTLRSVRERLQPRTVGADRRGGALEGVRQRISQDLAATSIGHRLFDHIGRSLRIAEVTLPDLIAEIITFAAVGLISTALGIGALISIGVLSANVVWTLVIVALTALIAWQPVSTVQSRATQRRRELRRVTNDFVQMVAVGLTTNRSIEEAVSYAADIGDSDGFHVLQRTVASAQPMGVPVWEALATMAETYQLDELHGLANSMQRQAGVGVNVAGTIRAEARSLRAKQLSELAETADKANANLSLPTMGMVMGVVLFIGYPIVEQILSAFS